MAFVQLVAFGYLDFAAHFVGYDKQYHIRGSWIFLAAYGLLSSGGGTFAAIQFYTYNKETKERGPIPVGLVATVDYAWFSCLVIKGFMYPRAPSVQASYQIVSDDDFIVVEGTHTQSLHDVSIQTGQTQPSGEADAPTVLGAVKDDLKITSPREEPLPGVVDDKVKEVKPEDA